ncbi:MAG: toxin HicA [Chloroflexota bacterium]|nr:toxin HicA [Chloroflexota bacterium]MDE2684570.1 toxin HicA [Chloroflexota bacterium]
MNIDDAIATLSSNPKGVRFNELAKICDEFFGEPRQSATSHRVYKMPWPGDPRANIQDNKGMAKTYQVRQVIKALERLKVEEQKSAG